ncbi:os-9-related [Anaeramoeba flamelloides]|uniref:Os-9-related n=1 Tax=Anaeramoeba flamelloides TaxID=1746091 RepID=A0ABQ8XRC0_9EUKA|nr:os-9-related [Anaeramoeba flamelloides]
MKKMNNYALNLIILSLTLLFFIDCNYFESILNPKNTVQLHKPRSLEKTTEPNNENIKETFNFRSVKGEEIQCKMQPSVKSENEMKNKLFFHDLQKLLQGSSTYSTATWNYTINHFDKIKKTHYYIIGDQEEINYGYFLSQKLSTNEKGETILIANYSNGDICGKIPGKTRSTVVIYECSPFEERKFKSFGNVTIMGVTELSVCQIEIRIHVSKMCKYSKEDLKYRRKETFSCNIIANQDIENKKKEGKEKKKNAINSNIINLTGVELDESIFNNLPDISNNFGDENTKIVVMEIKEPNEFTNLMNSDNLFDNINQMLPDDMNLNDILENYFPDFMKNYNEDFKKYKDLSALVEIEQSSFNIENGNQLKVQDGVEVKARNNNQELVFEIDAKDLFNTTQLYNTLKNIIIKTESNENQQVVNLIALYKDKKQNIITNYKINIARWVDFYFDYLEKKRNDELDQNNK